MERPLLLRNGTVCVDGALHAHTDLRIEDGVVAQVGCGLDAHGATAVDVADHLVTAGFVDLHIHGGAGVLCEDANPASIRKLSEILPRYGVTGFLPTLAALPPRPLHDAVAAIASAHGSEPGATILGIHLEGPFLNPQMAGAQNPHWMRAPSVAELDALQAAAGGLIRLITLAPEIDGALPFIAAARQRGIAISIGHTAATGACVGDAIAAGATHVTHLFNAMRPLHHREPGPIGTALTDERLSVELICDGHHVAPSAVDLTWRCKAADKVVLVSDAVAVDLADGSYEMFGSQCLISGGTIRLAIDGTLAGSTLGLDRAVRNLHTWLPRVGLLELLATVSSSPAAVIGMADASRIRVGGPANLTVLDRELHVAMTVCRGVLASRSTMQLNHRE